MVSSAPKPTRASAPAGWRIPAPRTGGGAAPGPGPEARLSDRDRELLRHLAEGRSTGQIATALSVSSNTARTRIRRVSGKLAVTDRTEVVRVARALGLV